MTHLRAFFPTDLEDARERRRTFALSLRLPDPAPPLSNDLWRLIVRRYNRSAGRGRPLGAGFARWHLAVLNGYHYQHHETREPWRPRSAVTAAVRFLLQAPAANWLHARWRAAALPRVEHARQRLAELAAQPQPDQAAAAGLVLDLAGALDDALGYAFLLAPLASEATLAAPRLLARLLGPAAPVEDLLAGAEGAAGRRAAALWNLTRKAHEQWVIEQAFAADLPEEVIRRLERSGEGREFLGEVRRFAAEHALLDPLALADLDDSPAWLQDVGALLVAIRQGLSGTDEAHREEAPGRRAALRERATAEARARLRAGALGWLRPWRRWWFDYVLRTALALQPLAGDCREDAPMRAAAALREALRLLARALVREGWLESSDELAFLTLADIETVARGHAAREALREAIECRRRRLRRFACLEAPARIAPVRAVERLQVAPAAPQADAKSLAGAPCSPGRATGPARHVDSPRDLSHFRRGDVLICGHGSAVHTILFSMAAAFVQEDDAAASQCALLAREYGVPAVAGVPGLARRVRDGQVLTVDGTSGTVSLEPEAHA
jgi:pyruvate,water dikinase